MEFLLLLIAHLIGDFIFQPMSLAVKKKTNFKYQILHAAIYSLTLAFVYILYFELINMLIFTILTFIIHLLIDYIRIIIARNKKPTFQFVIFLIDQGLHILIIFLTTFFLRELNILGININIHSVRVILGFVLVLSPASVFIKHILLLIDNQVSDICVDNDRIGEVIGMLERIIIIILGLLGLYTSIALVFTAKSLARFKQLENKTFAERYLVGTFLSLIFALIAIILIK